MSDAKLNFTVARGPLNVSGQPGVLTVSTPLTGTFEALGTLTGAAGNGVSAVGSAVGNLLGGRCRAEDTKPRRQGVPPEDRYPGQRDDDLAADNLVELAVGADLAAQVNSSTWCRRSGASS